MRTKKTILPIPTRAEMETLMGNYRALEIHRLGLQAEKEAALKKLDAQYAGSLEEIGLAQAQAFERLQAWADANPADFHNAQTLDLTHGRIGYRTGMPALKTLAGWTFDRVLERLKNLSWTHFIRVKQEVDKQAIIAQREQLTEDDLRGLGVRVVQEETFFVEPKLEES
jgi:phage host-nuclease inhibitor protein Gam